ncbi:MAG: hypothetical protein ACRDPW_09010, partial [Mycobacteriales bacterium]
MFLRRFLTAVTGALLVIAGALTLPTTAAAALQQPTSEQSVQLTSAVESRFIKDGAQIRTHPELSASVKGLGYRGQSVTLYC